MIKSPQLDTEETNLVARVQVPRRRSKRVRGPQTNPTTIGWREWMSLPQLHIPAIKIKADTGARTSCLHAVEIEPYETKDGVYVRFLVAPVQQHDKFFVKCTAPVVDQRQVRDSGGHTELRYVVETLLCFGHSERIIDLTLTARDNMRFRMLLGRTALSPDLIVDANSSFRLGHTEARLHYPNLFENDT